LIALPEMGSFDGGRLNLTEKRGIGDYLAGMPSVYT